MKMIWSKARALGRRVYRLSHSASAHGEVCGAGPASAMHLGSASSHAPQCALRGSSSCAQAARAAVQHPLCQKAGLLHGGIPATDYCQRPATEQWGAAITDGAGADALLPELLGTWAQVVGCEVTGRVEEDVWSRMERFMLQALALRWL